MSCIPRVYNEPIKNGDGPMAHGDGPMAHGASVFRAYPISATMLAMRDGVKLHTAHNLACLLHCENMTVAIDRSPYGEFDLEILWPTSSTRRVSVR